MPKESSSDGANINVQINTNANLEAEISLKFTEEIAEDLIMGDVETIALIIRKIEENLYENIDQINRSISKIYLTRS